MIVLFRRLGPTDLIELCRALRFSLSSGIMLREAMELVAERSGPRVRRVAALIARDLKAGWSLPDALQKQQNVLPPLFVSLATVGEESGGLPEVLFELEKYYTLRLKLRRDFNGQIAWPVFQFIIATFVVTFLLYLMGVLPRADRQEPLDPLGLGLVGPRGALIFFASVCTGLACLAVLYLVLKRLLQRLALVERLILRVPAVGPCLRALALARFCMAARLMLETSLSVLKTLRLAMLATDNAAFIAAIPQMESSLRRGNSITTSFEQAGRFPPRFLNAVAVGEESGRLPETLLHQGEEYDDEARRRMTWLTSLSAWLVWLAVAVVIIICIFRIFNEAYLKNIERHMPKPGRSPSLVQPATRLPAQPNPGTATAGQGKQ